MTIGSFCLVRNEREWMAPHLASWLPYLDEMVLYDGNSTDGTLDIIERFKKESAHGYKIKLFKDRDPRDLKDDYVKLFNDCLHELSTDLAAFIHPDFFLVDPGGIRNLDGGISYTMHLESYAGEPGGELYKIERGRSKTWKNIFTLRPNLGVHYFGHYGAANEDCYYSEITGDEHKHYGNKFGYYPYPVVDSGIRALHFSDVRPHARRLGRMVTCLLNQNYPKDQAELLAPTHPRVTLQDNDWFKFVPAEYPAEFLAAQKEVSSVPG